MGSMKDVFSRIQGWREFMTKTALITGATGGLGRAFATVFAKNGYDLILTGRDEERLAQAQKIAKGFGAKVLAVAADLTTEDGQDKLFAWMREQGVFVDVLVNNAGFGGFGMFVEGDPENQREMLEVNIAALVRLTRLFLPGMIERGMGRVLNVASLAAFTPGPLMACYTLRRPLCCPFPKRSPWSLLAVAFL
jgi:short-subunit dehydrogenase